MNDDRWDRAFGVVMLAVVLTGVGWQAGGEFAAWTLGKDSYLVLPARIAGAAMGLWSFLQTRKRR